MNGDSFVAAAVTDDLGGSVPLSDYVSQIEGTDVLGPDSLEPVLLGLYGEVGGIMSASKKNVREGAAFPGFLSSITNRYGLVSSEVVTSA